MAVEIVMPRMGLTMEEGTVIAWLKEENQPVAAGEPLLEIETDKSTVEIEAASAGILSLILVKPGETVPVGTVIGYLAAPEEQAALPAQPGAHAPAASVNGGKVSAPVAPAPTGRPAFSGKVRASPAARHLAWQQQVDLAQVGGTGPDGRVVAWNVQAFADQLAARPILKASPVARKVAAELAVDLEKVQGTGLDGRVTRADVERSAVPATAPEEPYISIPPSISPSPMETAQSTAKAESETPPVFEKLPVTRSQRVMAERMTASFRSAPHFYLHVEVDARKLTALRWSLLAKTEERFGVRLTFTDFLVKYSAISLLRHPRLLQQWAENGLLQARSADIGVAMDTTGGLIVPVIRDAARLGLAEIARKRVELYERARNGKLQPQDLELGAFTITNLGMFGIDSFDAILNPPQAAILAVGRIKERAMVENGQLIAAPMMNISLSVDHRVLDGASAARFLGELVELLESPELAQI
jgi:pyruvate dehydrogenase E2 component (dihydrolipoamide acetyltransferase)